MATPIDQLNFKVLLDDNDFRTRINEDITLASNLNTSLGNIVKVKGRQIITTTGVNNARMMSQYLVDIANKIRTMPKANIFVGDADRLNATLAETNKRLDQIIAKSQKAGQWMGATGKNLMRTWMRFSSTLWSIIGAVRLFTNTFGEAIKNISNFQQANANLATIMQVSRKEIETLTNDALMLGRTTEWTASQVTELQTALAKLGYDIPQIRNMQASVLQFATAVGAKLPEAANLAGASLRMFGMHSSEMQRALEILTASTNKTALDFEKLKVSLPYVGAIAHSIGFDIAQTASLLGVLTNAGLESSRAGTGLRQVLLELSKTNGKLQTAMGGNIKSFDDFVNGLQKMRDRGLQAGEATKLVSTRASSALLILANGVDTIKKLNDEVRDTDGLLKDIQQERLDTLHGSTLLLKSAWEGLIQTFRDSAGPMKNMVDWLTKLVRATSLAAGRANRIAQGTKDYVGSDELAKKYQDIYEGLRENGYSEEEATRLVREQLVNKFNQYQKALNEDIENSIEGKWWYKAARFSPFLQMSPLVRKLTDNATSKKYKRDAEAIEAVEAAWGQVSEYIERKSKEDAEIAANNFLNKWKATFDAEGKEAAIAAMDKVAGYENIKAQVLEYIKEGGAAGANDRGKGKTQKEINQELISDLRAEATYLRRLYDDYMKLVPLLGEEGAAEKMSEILDGGDYSKESLEQGILDITNALKGLGDEGEDAAKEILRSWGLDEFSRAYKQLQNEKKAAEDAQKALDKYNETLRKWQSEDFNLSGIGFEYDISKVFSDLNTSLGKVDEKYIDAVEQAKEAHKGDAEAIEEETNNLKELRDAEKEYLRVKAQERVGNLAESYLQDQYFLRGVSLDHLGDLSLKQLSNLKKELQEISQDALKTLTEMSGIEGFLGSLGIDLENLTDEALESLNDKLPESTIEMIRFWKAAKDTGISFETLNEKIQSAIKKGLQNLDEEEKKSIAKFAKYAAKQVLGLADSLNELADASKNVRLGSVASAMKGIGDFASSVAQGFSQGGIAGGAIALIVTSVKGIIDDMANDAKAAADAMEKLNEAQRLYNKELENTAIASQSTIFGDNALGKVRVYMDILRKSRKEIDDILGLNAGDDAGARETRRLLEEYGLIDENGKPIMEMISAALDSGAFSGEKGDAMKDALDSYKDSIKGIDDAMESLFGNIASSAADTIIDSWIEAGNAALDYTDILDDVARAYSKMLIQSVIMETALDPITDDLKAAFLDGRYGDAMSMVAGAMQAIESATPMYEQILNTFDPYFNRSGSESSSSLGSGIKSITEDTANLLASYINAIRADVSVMRGLQEKGWSALSTSIPTLNDYLNQIAGNTYDTAQYTQSILSELQSVIGAPGTNGMVVRVEYA